MSKTIHCIVSFFECVILHCSFNPIGLDLPRCWVRIPAIHTDCKPANFLGGVGVQKHFMDTFYFSVRLSCTNIYARIEFSLKTRAIIYFHYYCWLLLKLVATKLLSHGLEPMFCFLISLTEILQLIFIIGADFIWVWKIMARSLRKTVH
jgi:hypothetical protein